jgi:DNA-binding PadR family transcriptional regulator
MTDLVLLTALLGGPAYGYALKRTAGLIFGRGTLHNNIVYPLLKKFVESGWVEQSTVPGDRGQQRKQYRITEMGRKYLLEQIAEFGEREASNDGAFLFRVAMFDFLPEEKRKEILTVRKAHLAVRLKDLYLLEKTGKAKSFSGVVLERILNLVRDEIQWITRELELPKRRERHANGRVRAGIRCVHA